VTDSGRPIKVLLVEDDEDDFVLARDLLSEVYGEACQLDWEDTCDGARDAIGRGKYDVALIDFRLGACNGLDLVRDAMANGSTEPLILLTGHDSLEVDLEAMDAGATDYLVKGEITAPMLERSIRYAIERKKAEAALRESEKSIRAIIETTDDSVFLLGPQGLCLSINRMAAERLNVSTTDILGRNIFDFMPAEVAKNRKAELDKVIQSGKPIQIEDQRAGKWFETHIHPVFDEHGGVSRVAVFARDITGRKKTAEIIYHQANFDGLTDLPNRNMFHDRFSQSLKRARRSRSMVALMYIDLDGFKEVNDTMDHGAGDLLLQEAAVRLTACVREVDTVARIGGDEFTIILPDIQKAFDVESVARKVLARLAEPFVIRGTDVSISGSVGVTVFPDDAEGAETLLRNADIAMYRAKEGGRNAFRFFSDPLD
jgi:diguanylate cyclase (GGDEF)-like protein/PAS domain S-box-containing protein